jgi:hypothetical protein
MDEKTEWRDAWTRSKNANLPTFSKGTAALNQEIRRGISELSNLLDGIERSGSFSDFYAAVEKLCEVSRRVSQNTHSIKAICDFGVSPATLFTDHFLNQYCNLPALKRTWWVEGAALCGFAIEPGCRVLELGCGTGYHSDIFFSLLQKR